MIQVLKAIPKLDKSITKKWIVLNLLLVLCLLKLKMLTIPIKLQKIQEKVQDKIEIITSINRFGI
jgi:hypothetical protein